jgi:hypothetical protein
MPTWTFQDQDQDQDEGVLWPGFDMLVRSSPGRRRPGRVWPLTGPVGYSDLDSHAGYLQSP